MLPSLLLLPGCGKGNGAPAGGGKGKGGGFRMPPTPVEVAEVKPTAMTDRFQTVGTVEAAQAVTVVSEIDGIVKELPFREGSILHQGDLIALLDDSQLKAEVDRTTALRDQSRATYDRVRSIVEQKAGSQQDLDDAAAALKVAEANLALAQARWLKTRITAPFEGRVGSRKVSPGAFLRAGTPITEMAAVRQLRVDFAAPERLLGQLHQGAEVDVSSPAFPGVQVKGRILVVEPVLDPTTRNARLVAVIQNPDDQFRPGMSANVSAVLQERDHALVVPNESLVVEGNQSFVYVVRPDSTVTRTPLELGSRQADVVEVLAGLQPGMKVVRAGHQKLYEGAKVMPITSRPPEEHP